MIKAPIGKYEETASYTLFTATDHATSATYWRAIKKVASKPIPKKNHPLTSKFAQIRVW